MEKTILIKKYEALNEKAEMLKLYLRKIQESYLLQAPFVFNVMEKNVVISPKELVKIKDIEAKLNSISLYAIILREKGIEKPYDEVIYNHNGVVRTLGDVVSDLKNRENELKVTDAFSAVMSEIDAIRNAFGEEERKYMLLADAKETEKETDEFLKEISKQYKLD